MAVNMQNVALGIWGGARAGKTTYLSALQIAALMEPGEWLIRGKEDIYAGSIDFLANSTMALTINRTFPQPTQARSRYAYSVTGRPSQAVFTQIRDSLFGRPNEISFVVNFLDQPGGDYYQLTDPQDELWQYLAECRGIVYLYDPLRDEENPAMPNYAYLVRALQLVALAVERLQGGSRLVNGRLPHYLAICLAKYDEPALFQRLWKENLIQVDARGRQVTPRVIDARAAFDLVADPLTNRLLETYFLPNRVQYFATSSIGFYSKTPGMIDPQDCYNVDHTAQAPRLRGPVVPVDVFSPLVWLADRVLRNP